MEISSEVEPDEHHSNYPRPSILSSFPISEEETSFSFELTLETRDKYGMLSAHSVSPTAVLFPTEACQQQPDALTVSSSQDLLSILDRAFKQNPSRQSPVVRFTQSFKLCNLHFKTLPVPPHLLVPRTQRLSWVSPFEDGTGAARTRAC